VNHLPSRNQGEPKAPHGEVLILTSETNLTIIEPPVLTKIPFGSEDEDENH